jgi:hypothetical protein
MNLSLSDDPKAQLPSGPGLLICPSSNPATHIEIPVDGKTHTVQVLGVALSASVDEKFSLLLTKSGLYCNKEQRYAEIIANDENELVHRLRDMVFVDKDIADLQASFLDAMDGDDSIMQNLHIALGIKRTHKQRIAALESPNVSVTYEDSELDVIARLPAGSLSKVSFLPHPVVRAGTCPRD